MGEGYAFEPARIIAILFHFIFSQENDINVMIYF